MMSSQNGRIANWMGEPVEWQQFGLKDFQE